MTCSAVCGAYFLALSLAVAVECDSLMFEVCLGTTSLPSFHTSTSGVPSGVTYAVTDLIVGECEC